MEEQIAFIESVLSGSVTPVEERENVFVKREDTFNFNGGM